MTEVVIIGGRHGNGDIKQTSPDGAVVYFYASAQTTHISQPDGTQLYMAIGWSHGVYALN